MSPGMIKFLIWAAIIFLVAYAFNINLVALATQLGHSLQTVHQTNGGH